MSWAFRMYAKVGEDGELIALEGFEANYTYNVAPMFFKAFESKEGIRLLDGKEGKVALKLIENALEKMENEEEYRFLDPSNHWGSYEGAIGLLKTLRAWCHRAPLAVISVT